MNGEDLRTRRIALGISQEDVADILGLTGEHRRQTVQRMETGRYPIGEHLAAAAVKGFAKIGKQQAQLEARIEKGLSTRHDPVKRIAFLIRLGLTPSATAKRLDLSRQYVGQVLRHQLKGRAA